MLKNTSGTFNQVSLILNTMNLNHIKTGIICTIFPLFTFAQSNTFLVKGKVNPSHNGELVSIAYSNGTKSVRDSSIVTDGTFTLSGETTTPAVAYLRMGKVQPANVIDFYLAQGNTMISTTDSLKFAAITGNKPAEDYARLMTGLRPLGAQRVANIMKYQAIPAAE
ncbi:MAG TPA: DUF4369 domain-containing protein, partial [Pedobacter sp.]